ncbi:hypothetical protein D3C86_1066990 [compost metagenome]
MQAPVIGDARQGVLQHLERTVLGGQAMQEDDVQHDPANRQQAVGRTEQRRGTGHVRRHAEGEDRDQQGRDQGEQRRQVRLDMKKSEGRQHHHHRHSRHER